MRIKLPDPPAHAAAKPQLHSQANHDAYDGALHIPLRTDVRVERLPSKDNTNSNADGPDNFRYIITLYYPHNRACEIYRSASQVFEFKRTLAAEACGLAPKPLDPEGVANNNNTGGSSTPLPAYIPCCRKCSHASLCPGMVQEPEARSAGDLNQLLEQALGMVRAGNNSVKVTVGWFLRRRRGDCGCGDEGDLFA